MKTIKQPSHFAKLGIVGFALAFVALCVGANEYYNQDKITEDLHTACKEFAIASDGAFSALCITDPSLAPVKRSLDLDLHIGNNLSKNELRWGYTNFSSKCDSLSVTVHSKGVTLKGNCDRADLGLGHRGGAGTAWKEWKELELNDGIKSDSGDRGVLKRR